MKAITIHQPWASLIAHGYKRYETRSWKTNYRGPIAIHASKRFIKIDLPVERGSHQYYLTQGVNTHMGSVIAIADLVDCWKVLDKNLIEAQPPSEKRVRFLDAREIPFGDFTPGRYAWELANIRRIEPIPAKGQQGLWNWGGERDA